MLTDGQIREAIKKKNITIDPFDSKHLKAGKYNIHLGKIILSPEKSNTLVDPTDPQTAPSYKELDITNSSYIIHPGEFILGQTQEAIGLSDKYAFFLDGSGTLARLGLTIHQSAFFISPGQDPHTITLEMFNAGIWDIKLSLGMQVGKLLGVRYEQANEISEKSFNKYNGATKPTGAKFA